MPKQVETTHVITDKELVVYRRNTSSVYQCRYKVGSKWQRATTHTADLKEAIAVAKKMHITAHVRKENNFVPIQRYFKDIAKLAIQRMLQNEAYGNGKVIYRNYIMIINKYLIKYFGKFYVDNITHNDIKNYSDWRIKQLGRVPKRSTVIAHNAALNLIFEEAKQRGYLTDATKPKLKVDVKATDVRDAFTFEEVVAIRNNFDNWISLSRQDSIAVRSLLKDYVFVLLDTGARPGKEILNLRWIDVEYQFNLQKTNEKIVTDDGVEEEYIKNNPNVYLKIAEAKTKTRTANGYIDTITALRNIAKRNYNKSLQQLLLEKNKDYIFRYREIVTKRQKDKTRVAQLKKPTSFSKLFDEYLTEVGLLYEPTTNKKRVFYSLRHSYATFQLLYENTNIEVRARQMGTSMAMISKFYSDVTAKKATEQLRGNKIYEMLNGK